MRDYLHILCFSFIKDDYLNSQNAGLRPAMLAITVSVRRGHSRADFQGPQWPL